jgi:predicted methyltransferase
MAGTDDRWVDEGPGAEDLPWPTELAHDLVRRCLRPGETAVDATAGNGHDTEFLARQVGPGGRVIGFDVQARAIEATRSRLDGLGEAPEIVLCEESHVRLAERTPDGVGAVMFNLGYLPGGDRRVTTERAGTLAALEAAWTKLRPGGVMTVVCYPGHEHGAGEAAAVVEWAGSRGAEGRAARYGMLGALSPTPVLVAVFKMATRGEGS